MQEALALARNELGDEAVVLNTRYVKTGGLLGVRGGNKVELMAAVDEAHTPCAHPLQPAVAVTAPASPLAARLYGGATDVAAAPAPCAASSESLELRQLKCELRDLTAVVNNLLSRGSAPTSLGRPLLLRVGVDEDLARGTMPELLSIDDPASLAAALAGKTQAFALPPALETRQVIAVVGPTGVGKTTTLAKLAAKVLAGAGQECRIGDRRHLSHRRGRTASHLRPHHGASS